MTIVRRLAFAATLFLTSASIVQAQNFRIPEHYTLSTPDDYHKYDKDIIKCVNWLERTPPGDDDDHVKRVGRFMSEWITGCPYVRFTSNARIDAFLGDSPEYRIYYMAGWAKYALESKMDKPDRRLCTYAAIKTVIKVYQSTSHAKKDSNIEELVKMDSQSKLHGWVNERS